MSPVWHILIILNEKSDQNGEIVRTSLFRGVEDAREARGVSAPCGQDLVRGARVAECQGERIKMRDSGASCRGIKKAAHVASFLARVSKMKHLTKEIEPYPCIFARGAFLIPGHNLAFK